ncbi:unnamed protein product, partial [marine sediment metagenome]
MPNSTKPRVPAARITTNNALRAQKLRSRVKQDPRLPVGAPGSRPSQLVTHSLSAAWGMLWRVTGRAAPH